MMYFNVIDFVNELIDQYRVEIGARPETTPVRCKGVYMSLDEAKKVIKDLEVKKINFQERMNNTQTGGEITELATAGAGIATMVTGVALTFFLPPVGMAVLASGAGVAGIGKMVGEAVINIGTNSNSQAIKQIDDYIGSLQDAIHNI